MGTLRLSPAYHRLHLLQRVRETVTPLVTRPANTNRIAARPQIRVLAATSEIYPLIKTGGLADVTGALPKALAGFDIETHTLVPGYPALLTAARLCPPLMEFDNLLGERATLRHLLVEDLSLLVLDAPALYERGGGPYVDQDGNDHPDNWKRFAVLSLAAAEIAAGVLPGWQPDLVHTHDWQTALTSVYMRSMDCRLPVVLTIHNIAFQGQFSPAILPEIGLPPDAYTPECMEYYGDVSFLKGGLATADHITVVSPTYAREILSRRFGMGLDGVLRSKLDRLQGIVNGIDTDVWDPASDPALPFPYDARSPGNKKRNREVLLDRFGLTDGKGPLFSVVSRLTWQKGMDMLADVVDEVFAADGRLIVLGQGDHDIEQALTAKVSHHPGLMAVSIGYDEATAHLIHGGSDAIIQPSRFEPCGLTQLYGLRYGCIPVVSRTGGLSETIIDANDAAVSARVATGFQFHPVHSDGLRHAIRRACQAYRDKRKWTRMQSQAMRADYSWDRSASSYAAVYAGLVKAAATDG